MSLTYWVFQSFGWASSWASWPLRRRCCPSSPGTPRLHQWEKSNWKFSAKLNISGWINLCVFRLIIEVPPFLCFCMPHVMLLIVPLLLSIYQNRFILPHYTYFLFPMWCMHIRKGQPGLSDLSGSQENCLIMQ